MAGGQYTARSGGSRCSFGIAMQFLALRDLSAAQAAPDVFALDNWPNELLRLFWTLWGALERGLVHAYFYGEQIPASDLISDRFKLEEVLRHRDVLGLFPFIGAAAQLTKHRSVDADELIAAFAPPSAETPPAALHGGEGAAPLSKPRQDDGAGARKPLPIAPYDKLVGWCKEAKEAGARNRSEVNAYVRLCANGADMRVMMKGHPEARREANAGGTVGRRPKPVGA